nr:SMP-30/gluconolactonase/LRE family protein [uncultured Dyadobacter sp.]
MTIETVLSHRCELGEGPVWDMALGVIWWVDILKGEIHRYDPKTGSHERHATGQMVGSVALRSQGGLIAAMEHGFYLVDFENRSAAPVADPEPHLPGNRFNDGKCDPAGRFWAGTMSMRDENGAGALYRLDKDRSVTTELSGVGCSNGLAWSADCGTFYYIDSLAHDVKAFDYNIVSGQICNSRTIVQFSPAMGYPDGMTVDHEGMLWVALWDGWKVIRCDPRNGRLLDEIVLPVSRVTSCTFGGAELSDLYITTARAGLRDDELANQPLAGCLFVVKNSGYRGVPADRCSY